MKLSRAWAFFVALLLFALSCSGAVSLLSGRSSQGCSHAFDAGDDACDLW